MQQNMPNGPGICYERKDNKHFDFEPMLPTVGWSYESLNWLSFMESQPPFKTSDNKAKIRHALNGGEIEISIESRVYKVDGYAIINGVKYFLEFDGCVYHEHTCKASRESKFKKKCDLQRNKDLESLGQLIQIYECEWLRLKSEIIFKNTISQFFARKNIKEQEIMDAVRSGSFYGLIRVDIRSPDSVINHFMKANFPPIFAHVAIEEEMVGPKMREQLKNRGAKYPLSNQLTLVFNQDQYIMTTDLALFYMDKGMELSNLTLAIEYTRSKPLKKFIDTVTEKRKEATVTGDTNLQNTWKLVSNSCYGRLSLNLKKRRQYKYKTSTDAPIVDENPFITNITPVVGEFETNYVEVTRKKRRITDKVPGMYIKLTCS